MSLSSISFSNRTNNNYFHPQKAFFNVFRQIDKGEDETRKRINKALFDIYENAKTR
jgi:hypothetical protein